MFAASKSGRAGISGDSSFPSVPLLLETTTASARSTVATDSSTNAFTVTRNGTPSTGWTGPYQTDGYWGNYFNGSSSLLSIAQSTATDLGSSSFTLEMWIYFSGVVTSAYNITGKWNSASQWILQWRNAGLDSITNQHWRFYFNGSVGTDFTEASTTSVAQNTWYHIALVKNGSNYIFYRNGVQIGSTYTNATAITATSDTLTIASAQNVTTPLIGYISNYRLVVGTAVYTSAFTPSTTPLTAITNTQLLTCQSNRFKDNSTNNFTITVNGTPQVTSDYYPSTFTAPAASLGAGYFNGTSDYLTLATSLSGLALGSSDFTVEAWVYRISGTGTAVIYNGQGDYAAAAGSSLAFYISSSATSDLYIGATGYGITSPNPTLNTWTHLAWARTSGTFSSYLNGTRVGTRSDLGTGSVNVGSITYPPSIGAGSYPANYLNGYISNFRFIKGSGGYNATSATITVPTAPLTAIANTQLLVNLADSNYVSATDGVQNNTFIDSGPYAFPITRVGTATQGSFTPYWPNGQWSNYFNGSTDYLTVPTSTNWDIFDTNFTVEANVFFTSFANYDGAAACLVSRSNWISNNWYGWQFYFTGPTTGYTAVGFTVFNGASTNNSALPSYTFLANTWYHVAGVKNGSTLYIYVNGTLVGTQTYTSVGTSSTTLKIGRYSNEGVSPTLPFPGYISNLRIVKGTAVYTANFTPPTTPLTAITNTSLLTCQSNRFKDNSTNNFTITPSGTPRVQAFQPFSPTAPYTAAAYGGSGYFNGSTDILTASSSAAFGFGTGDFTVEFWIYPLVTANTWSIYHGTATNAFIINTSSTGQVVARSYAVADLLTTTATLAVNAWTHLAVTRSGTTLTIWLNGVSSGTVTNSTNFATTGLYIGRADSVTAYLNGYISNLRIVKGTAVYNAAFTPPTAPVTAITNTSLLLNSTNAAIYDASAQNNTTTVDNTQASITQYKWAPTSMKFDGTGDSLTLPANPIFAWGTGDFTVELWANNSAAFVSTRNNLAGTMASGGGLFAPTNTNMNWNSFGVGDIVTAAYVPTIGQWYHLAYSRASGTGRLFINGKSVASASDSTNYTNTSFTVGGISTQYFNGYIQDLRVTRGIARYTTVFSVPTATISTTTTTVLLLKTGATNGQQNNTFLDSSTNNFTITRNGTPTQGSVTPYWPDGYWSNSFNGSTDYFSLASNAAFGVGTGDLTIEAWVYCNSLSNPYQGIISTRVETPANYPGLGLVIDNSKLSFTILNLSGALTDSTNIPLNQWVHVAGVRSGTNAALFVNGVRKASGTNSENGTTASLVIGRYYTGSNNYYFNGNISNVRLVKGTAVYDPTQTTLTVPTIPLTAITNTSLLTCQSNRFIDNSSNAFAIAASGTPKVQTFQPFLPTVSYTTAAYGGSGYFNGSTDKLTTPTDAAFNLASGSWTIEGFFYFSALANYATMVMCNLSNTDGFGISLNGSNAFAYYVNGGGFINGAAAISSNTWYHVAAVSNGTTTTLYVNGTSIGTTTTLPTSKSYPVTVGAKNNSVEYFTGYASNVRVVKGTAVYTANFTPPTAPVTAIANTSLLLNGTNAGIYDAAAQNNQITIGDTQASTTQFKWSPTSMKFDGAGDWLSTTIQPIGSGDFTIEFWMYHVNAECHIFTLGTAWGDATGVQFIYYASAAQYCLTVGASTSNTWGPLIQNAWTHVAITRNSGTVKLYWNGVANASSFTSNTTNLTATSLTLGYSLPAGSAAWASYSGYIQDFRITKEVAPAITPPTAAFLTR